MLKAIQHKNMVFKMRRIPRILFPSRKPIPKLDVSTGSSHLKNAQYCTKPCEWIMARNRNVNKCADLNSRAKVAVYHLHLNGTVGDADQ